VNSSDKRTVALVMLNYAIALPPICVAVYQYPPTVPIILLTVILAFWTWVLVEHIMWRKEMKDNDCEET
jgi:hypothetical protein